MTNFDYIISSHSEASLMFPLYEDSNQRPLSDDEKNLFRHDLQLQFTVLEAVSVVLHHIGIKFPDPAKPSPKILTTDN